MMNGSAALVLRGLSRRAARNNVPLAAACMAASVACVIAFLGVGAEPHTSIVLLDFIGLTGIFMLAMAVLFALLNKIGTRWALVVAFVVFAGLFSPFLF
jgi:hypothetical protein